MSERRTGGGQLVISLREAASFLRVPLQPLNMEGAAIGRPLAVRLAPFASALALITDRSGC
jgi:hypothetical protein